MVTLYERIIILTVILKFTRKEIEWQVVKNQTTESEKLTFK